MENTQPVPGFRVEQEVSAADIAGLLCSAFEGGSNYWCSITAYQEPKEIHPVLDKKKVFRHTDFPLLEGGAVICRDTMEEPSTDEEDEPIENEDGTMVDAPPVYTQLVLDREAIQRGLRLMAEKHPHHWANFVGDNSDAITGDVFLQLCLLGDIIYG